MRQIIFSIFILCSFAISAQRTAVQTAVMSGDTVLYKATYHDVYTFDNVDSVYVLDTTIMVHFDAEYPRPFPDTIEHALTFANGVTRTVNFVRNDLITGKSGGQTVVGGTASGDDLTISSTTNGTKGNINFGNSTYNEVTNNLGLGTSSPYSGFKLDVYGDAGFQGRTYIKTGGSIQGINAFPGSVASLVLQDLGGNVGIGITNPSQSLTVSSPTTYEGILVKGNVAPNISFVQNAGTTPAYKVGLSGNDGTALSISSGAGATDLVHIKSSGNVGIGTTSPSQKLSILRPDAGWLAGFGANGVQDLLKIGYADTYTSGETTLESSPYGSFGLRTQNNRHLLLMPNGTGNVGIGTTSPNAKLHALLGGTGSTGPTGTTIIGQNSAADQSSYLTLVGAYNAEAGIVFTDESIAYKGKIGYSNSTEDLYFNTNGTEKMRVLSSGNVGIGTASPSAALEVVGNIVLSGDIKSTGKVGAGTSSPDRTLHTIDATALTNTITYPLRVSHATSGTPAISFGVGIESELENASGTDKVASAITTVWADPTNGTEDAQMEIALMKNGSLATGVVIDNDGNVLVTSETYGAGWSGSKEVPTKDDLYDKIESLQAAIIGAIYPVGSLYTSTVSTNPGTILGVGTWVAFGAGRVMVGIDAGQTEFDTVEETGGAKTHTLTVDEMPAHTHTISSTTADGGGTNIVDMGVTASGSVTTGSAGGGAAHNNLQPYIIVYMWKRTS